MTAPPSWKANTVYSWEHAQDLWGPRPRTYPLQAPSGAAKEQAAYQPTRSAWAGWALAGNGQGRGEQLHQAL